MIARQGLREEVSPEVKISPNVPWHLATPVGLSYIPFLFCLRVCALRVGSSRWELDKPGVSRVWSVQNKCQ